MFAARATTKVLPGQQHAGARISGLIEHEVRIEPARTLILSQFALVEVAPLIEQVRAKTSSLDRLQELLRDDGVGVDVRAIERCDEALVDGKCLHGLSPFR